MKNSILIYGTSPEISGVSEYMMNLYRNIYRKNFEFDFIVTGHKCFYEQEIENFGGKVLYITPKRESLLNNIKELFKVIRRNSKKNNKIFYFNTSGIYYVLPVILAKLYKYKVIVHAHNTKDVKIKNYVHILHYLNRILVRNISDEFFACSELAGKWVFGGKFFENNNVKIINNAINCSKFRYNPKINDMVRKTLNISKDKLIIGSVGRLDYQKNQSFLLDVFYEILKINKESVLILVGEGELKNKLVDKAKKLRIYDKVKFLGARTDVNEIMQSIDIFLLTSLFEGFPITLVEAQAAGIPCIVSDTISKETKIIDNLKFCALDKGAKHWAEKVIKLKDGKKDTYDVLVKKSFDINKQSSEIEKIIDSFY